MSKENILGTLVVVLLKAQHLIDNHTFYKQVCESSACIRIEKANITIFQDPYAKLSLGGAEKRTPADPKGGQHPVWDHEVRIPISKDATTKNRTLELSCWSEERTGDQLLGEGKLDIAKTLQTGEFDGAYHNLLPTAFVLIEDSSRLGPSEHQWHSAWRDLPRDDLLCGWTCSINSETVQIPSQ